MQTFPKPLMAVVGLLALGMCVDAAVVYASAGLMQVIAIAMLAARLAAIGGVLTLKRWGFYAGLGFFLISLVFTVLAGRLVGAAFPVLGLVLLGICRDEFE